MFAETMTKPVIKVIKDEIDLLIDHVAAETGKIREIDDLIAAAEAEIVRAQAEIDAADTLKEVERHEKRIREVQFSIKRLQRERTRTLKGEVKDRHDHAAAELAERIKCGEQLKTERDEAQQKFNDLALACRQAFDLARSLELQAKDYQRAMFTFDSTD